jgi:hypothetical protein
VILTCWLIDATTQRRREIGAGLLALAFLGQIVAFVAIARRFGMGRVEGLNIVDWLTRPRWEPGLPPGLLLAGFLVAALGLLAIGVRALLATPPVPSPVPPLADVTAVAPRAGTSGTESGHG